MTYGKPHIGETIDNTDLFESDQRYRSAHFHDDDYSHLEISNTEWNQCVIENMTLSQTHFDNCYFIDVLFKNCDLSNAHFNKSLLRRVSFSHCKIMGSDFVEDMMELVHFENVLGHYANFSSLHNKGLSFLSCDLSNGYFTSCEMKKTTFEDTKLLACEFLGSPLRDIDLSSDVITGIRINPQDIAGATIDEWQAIDIVGLLRIKIK